MQSLLDQYSNDCSQLTPGLTKYTAHCKQAQNSLLPKPRTSSFCNQKHIPVSHQKASLAPISKSRSQKELKSSELSSHRNSNKQTVKHLNPITTKPHI